MKDKLTDFAVGLAIIVCCAGAFFVADHFQKQFVSLVTALAAGLLLAGAVFFTTLLGRAFRS